MIEVVLFIIIILLLILLFVLFKKAARLESELDDVLFRKNSQSVRYGKITEQFTPFVDEMPFSPENFRFLGSPIDGVAFEPDSIVFCEFKTAASKLSQKQKDIKQLVNDKKVKWLEFRLR